MFPRRDSSVNFAPSHSAVPGLGLHSFGFSHGEMELKVDKRRSVILWLEPEQLLNDSPYPLPPARPTPSSFQISHRPSGLSGQHHVDHRPLVPISPPSPCVVSLRPMVKRPRRVPFHISFGLVSGLGSVFVALPCSAPWWLSGAEFPLLWFPKSPLIDKKIDCAIYYWLFVLFSSVADRKRDECRLLEW